ncbi:hypothetical protein [Thermincola ferriacetica]|uniref:hypothetical protein n=1 Tax=Thermincola ferriacetica TaxID=281456 RepID=UPI001364AE2E|nr:hypothetical protein [Thermincola ferriacetica]
MRLGEGWVDSVNDSEGLKSLFPARTPETRPQVRMTIRPGSVISTERSLHCLRP